MTEAEINSLISEIMVTGSKDFKIHTLSLWLSRLKL